MAGPAVRQAETCPQALEGRSGRCSFAAAGQPWSVDRLPALRKRDASARHLWAECPQYDRLRAQLQEELGLDAGWWLKQPRVTAKSGWITYAAAKSRDGRLKALIAANRLGVIIVEECWQNNARTEGQRPRACRH